MVTFSAVTGNAKVQKGDVEAAKRGMILSELIMRHFDDHPQLRAMALVYSDACRGMASLLEVERTRNAKNLDHRADFDIATFALGIHDLTGKLLESVTPPAEDPATTTVAPEEPLTVNAPPA